MGSLFNAFLVSCCMAIVINCEETTFLEQPEPVLAPLGTQVELTCRVAMGYKIVWIIGVPGVGEVDTEGSETISALSSRGIETEVSSAENREPTLIISGTVENNQTTAQCRALNVSNIFQRSDSDVVTITFYGPPSTPADIAATENGVGSLNISWSLVTIEGVVVNFTVTFTNLNDSSTGPMEVSGIQDQHYIFTLQDSTLCDVYSFQVTAVNGAGTGTSSEIITRSLPSLPDISSVQNSIQYSLVRTASGVTLNITFNDATSCPAYPPHNYTLVVVEDSGENLTDPIVQTELANGGSVIRIAVSDLMENTHYLYSVIATNEFGSSHQSTSMGIATTYVQNVSICQVDSTNYFIQCSYLSGSDVSGCVYVLVSGEEGVENVTGFIERDSNGVTLEVANIGCYSEVLAYDNIESLPVITNISHNIILCLVTTVLLEGTPSGEFNVTAVVVGVVVFVIVAMVLVLAVVLSCTFFVRRCDGNSFTGPSFVPGPSTMDENYDVVQHGNLNTNIPAQEGCDPCSEDPYSKIQHSSNKKPFLPEEGYAQIDPVKSVNPDLLPDKDPIYNVLEDPNQKPPLPSTRYSVDPNAPDIPAYCPAGGDSPS